MAEYIVEVTCKVRVTVDASNDEQAEERAIDAAVEQLSGSGPDDVEVEIIDGPPEGRGSTITSEPSR